MKKLYILLSAIFILLVIAFQSCNKQDRNADLITKAYDITESDPKKGLLFLDSITDPSHMHEDLYMRYIVIHNQARYKCDEDISKDSLIFEAEKYFENYSYLNVSALAHLCAANTHYEAKRKDKALYSYSKAAEKASLIGNNLIAGRSKNNIAYIYFSENMMDNAITNAKKALYYFEKEKNNHLSRMKVIALIGRAYEDKNSLDSAYSYFDRGLRMAKANNDLPMQAVFNHNLGLVMLGKNKLDKSADYLHTALPQTSVTQDSIKIYKILSSVYMQKNVMDSAFFYTKLIDNRLAEIHDVRTKKDLYGVLSEYMQNTGDYKEAFRYTKLQFTLDKKIFESDVTVDLIKAHNSLIILNNEKENSRFHSIAIVLISLIVVFVTVNIFILGFLLYRKYNKMEQQRDINSHTIDFEKEKKNISDRLKYYRNRDQRNKEKIENDKSNAETNIRTVLADSYLSTFMLYKELNVEWRLIDDRLIRPLYSQDSKSKPRFQEYMDGLLAYLKEKSDTKLNELVKNCLTQTINGGDDFISKLNIILKLEQKELIILALSNSRYSDEVIGDAIDLKAQYALTQRIELKYKLQKIGFTEEEIKVMLFPDYKSMNSPYLK